MVNLKEITFEYVDSLKNIKEIKRDFSIEETSDIFAIVGPRRVGKTFLMLKKAKELIKKNKQVIYSSFDEPLLRNIPVREFAKLVRKEYPTGKVYLFLDEIREWKNWDFNLRWLHDVKDFTIFISGSSSKINSKEIPYNLRGRYISKLLLPLSFKELVNFKIKTFREKGKALNLLEDYLEWGGFPEVWINRSREKIVSLLDTMYYKDIIENAKIRWLEEFKEFFYFVLSNYSNRFTYNSLRRSLKHFGISLDTKTIIKYTKAIEESFLIFKVEKFSLSKREKLFSEKKFYLVDTCFSNLFEDSLDLGRKIENLVFLHLLRESKEVYYYMTKDRREIDFYLPKERVLIEVTLEVDERHLKKLTSAMKETKTDKGYIVTWDYEDILEKDGKTIEVIPLWKFLLST